MVTNILYRKSVLSEIGGEPVNFHIFSNENFEPSGVIPIEEIRKNFEVNGFSLHKLEDGRFIFTETL